MHDVRYCSFDNVKTLKGNQKEWRHFIAKHNLITWKLEEERLPEKAHLLVFIHLFSCLYTVGNLGTKKRDKRRNEGNPVRIQSVCYLQNLLVRPFWGIKGPVAINPAPTVISTRFSVPVFRSKCIIQIPLLPCLSPFS